VNLEHGRSGRTLQGFNTDIFCLICDFLDFYF